MLAFCFDLLLGNIASARDYHSSDDVLCRGHEYSLPQFFFLDAHEKIAKCWYVGIPIPQFLGLLQILYSELSAHACGHEAKE
jgi:hypothetical protein